MIKKWTIFIALAAFLFVLTGILKQPPKNENKQKAEANTLLQSEIYEIPNGYGYRLWSKNRLLVQQEVIPVYSGNQPFTSYEEAQKVAEMVLRKIRIGEDPRIRKEDLEQLGINIPNLVH